MPNETRIDMKFDTLEKAQEHLEWLINRGYKENEYIIYRIEKEYIRE